MNQLYLAFNGFNGLSARLMPVIKTLVNELSNLSWYALVLMLSVGGILMLMGNEFGAVKVCKNAVRGFLLVQIASMLL